MTNNNNHSMSQSMNQSTPLATKKSKVKKIIIPVVILISTFFISQVIINNPPESNRGSGEIAAKITVETLPLVPQRYTIMLNSFGTVQPRTQSVLVAQVSGEINEISQQFRNGGFFEKGDVLVQLDDRDHRAEVNLNQANLLSAKQALLEEQARAKQALIDWQRLGNGAQASALVLREPQLAAAQAQVLSAQANLEKAQLQLERTNIVAPFAGRILTKHVDLGRVVDHVVDPRTAGVDQASGGDCSCSFGALQCNMPQFIFAVGAKHFGPGHNLCAPYFGITGVQHNKARIFDPTVGVFIGLLELAFDRLALNRPRQMQRACSRQDLPPAEVVVHEQAQPDQPSRAAPLHPRHHRGQQLRGRRVTLEAHRRVIGQHEAHRPADMRHGAQQHLAFDQRLAHQPELEILEVAQPAVEQLGGGRRGCRGEIAHLGQADREPAPRRIARDAASVDAAADHEQIDHVDVVAVAHKLLLTLA